MSPDLDEISEDALRAELARREKLRAMGLCDYCERGRDTPSCKMRERHKGVIDFGKASVSSFTKPHK